MVVSVCAASSERAPGPFAQYTRIRSAWPSLSVGSATGDAGSARSSSRPRGMFTPSGMCSSRNSPGSRASTTTRTSPRLSASAACTTDTSGAVLRAPAIMLIRAAIALLLVRRICRPNPALPGPAAHRVAGPSWDGRSVGRIAHLGLGHVEEPIAVRERRCRRARGDPELEVDVLEMPGHRLDAQIQLLSDLLVAVPGRNQPEHLDLPRGQPARLRTRASQLGRPLGPQPLEDRLRAADRELGAVLVAQRETGAPEHLARLRGFERAIELLPQLPRAPE